MQGKKEPTKHTPDVLTRAVSILELSVMPISPDVLAKMAMGRTVGKNDLDHFVKALGFHDIRVWQDDISTSKRPRTLVGLNDRHGLEEDEL